jgi:hypothetical protein
MALTHSKTMEKLAFKLKPLSKDGVDGALEKAETYRLLNQPRLAESICQDILSIDSGNQKASIFLLLALTDQFGRSSSKAVKQAQEIASKLKDEYARAYYTGIILERQGSVALGSGIPGADFDACEWYLEAMKNYEKAESLATEGNNDPILRWNTCARIIMQYNLQERPQDDSRNELE